MSIQDIIRAWKDSSYRESLSTEQRALLPDNPIGEVLSQEELLSISGGFLPFITACCTDASGSCSCWNTDDEVSLCDWDC
jgi:mersacidin/lichenicidin family type 2 lantibiotic